MASFAKTIRAWVTLSRPPFHVVGVLPFILGSVLAWWLGGSFRWEILAWGTAGVVCVMLATYYAGELWDYAEDSLSGTMHGSPFAGGSQVVQRGLLPREAALWGSFAAVLLALGLGSFSCSGTTQARGPYLLESLDLWVVSFIRRSRRVGCTEDGASYGLHFVTDG